MPWLPVPDGAKSLPHVSCPACQNRALMIEIKLIPDMEILFPDVGHISFPAHAGYFLTCRACGASTEGDPDDDRKNATFDPSKMVSRHDPSSI